MLKKSIGKNTLRDPDKPGYTGQALKKLVLSVILGLVLVIFHPAGFVSSSYNLGEDFFDFGGKYGTSTNYILIDNIGNLVEHISHYVAPPPVPPNNPDTAPPAISNVQATNITYDSATITWTTDEPSSSYVNYGLTVSYGNTSGNSLMVLSHGVALSGLSTSTIYHFRVRSTDTSNNESVSSDYTFQTLTPPDTTPPIISNVAVSNLTDTSAAISWTTNEAADSLIDYGLTTSYGLSTLSINLVTSHSFVLTDLNRGTMYHFKITSKDAYNNSASTADLIFQTTDTAPPVISNLRIVDITETSANISWQTDELADSKIDYGLTTSYELGSVSDATRVLSHLIPLANLLPNTLYHIRAHSEDAAGLEAVSPDQTFLTLKDSVPPANVSNFAVAPGDSLNVLTWQNPIDVDFAGVLIKRSTSGFPADPSQGETVYNGTATNYTDRGLTNGVTYYYTAFAYDTSLNYASGALASGMPTAPPPPPPAEEVPPEAPGIPPGMPIPEVIMAEASPLEDFEFYLANRTIRVYPDSLSQITTLVGDKMSVFINREKFIVIPENITLNISDSNYLFASTIERYESDFSVPPVGEHNAIITIFYANNRASQANFKIIVKPKGFVYEVLEGERQPLDGAQVTLYFLAGGWQVWDAANYNQANPIIAAADGEFGFIVPNGTYYLKAEKSDYRTRETNRFEVLNNVVNSDIELLKTPPSLEEVIKPEAPLVENIKNVAVDLAQKSAYIAKIATQQMIDVAQNPAVEKANEQVAAPTVAAVAVVNTVAAANIFNVWAYLQYLLTQPIILLQRRKRKGWGVVYNSLSKLPLDLAIVRLFNQNTGRLIQTRVTDKEGRYLIMAAPGLYRLETAKRGFVSPTVYLKNFKEDGAYADLYHGETMEVKEKGAVITANIPLDPIEEKPSKGRLSRQRVLKGIQFALSFSVIILAGIFVIISPKIHTIIIFVSQIVLFLLFLRLARPPKPKGWGIVYDKETKHPLKQTVVRIFETQFDKLVGSQITDSKGRYAFLTGRNVYYVTAEKEGYESAKTDQIDIRKKDKKELVAPDIPLPKTKQENKEKIQFGDSRLEVEQ